jgi:D-galactarolactone cycloisomerase
MTEITTLKVTDIRLRRLKVVRDVGSLEPAWNPGGLMHFQEGGGAFVEVHTDAGITGIGPAVEAGLLPSIKDYLIGKDPFAVEDHLSVMNYYLKSIPYHGYTGIDVALWDIIGKACGQPLYKLWGGSKNKVPAYASMVLLSTPEERVDLATQLLAEGWQAIKLRLHYQTMAEDIALVEQVRQAVGDKMVIMVDANQAQSSDRWQPGVRWDYRRAVETARELQALDCYWLEEPLPRYAFHDLAKLNAEVELPIAGGENNPGLHEFVQMLTDEVYDILQPESMVSNGLTMLRKIGTLAEAFGKKVVPHHGGRNLGTIAHLHLVASWNHSPYLETLHDPPIGHYHLGFSILAEPPIIDGEGYIAVPQKPGLGVDINSDLIED